MIENLKKEIKKKNKFSLKSTNKWKLAEIHNPKFLMRNILINP